MAATTPPRRPRTVPGEQRVFSLILALVAAPQGLTKRELLSSVYGYAERYGSGDPASLERQFERDKDTLRELGVPLEVLESPEAVGNNQLLRYRIAKDRLQLPEDIAFSADEITLLKLASLAWQEGSLSDQSRRATMKLEALGAALDPRHLGVAPRLGSPEPVAQRLHQAIQAGRTVRFGYRHPRHPEPLERRVAPLALHRADGRWHLLAWDAERDADRVFLLSRIEGQVSLEREEFDPALRDRVPEQVARLQELERQQTALIEARPGSEAESRLLPRGAREHSGMIRFGFLDEPVLAEELASFGADVQVHAPHTLRTAVIAALIAIRDAHSAAAHEPGEESR